MTPERIRAAAQVLRVTYLPVLAGHESDWRERPDLSERLADLLDRQADAIADIRGRSSGSEDWMLLMPEYAALFALVDQIEGSHP